MGNDLAFDLKIRRPLISTIEDIFDTTNETDFKSKLILYFLLLLHFKFLLCYNYERKFEITVYFGNKTERIK